MADESSSLKSHAEIDREAVDRFNRLLQESADREAKLHKHYEWRGNKLPPMAIEPMGLERQRLAMPMTAEDRALRKQWVQDQKLSPNEPIFIEELYPKNPIRRLLSSPWNMFENMLKPALGKTYAGRVRGVASAGTVVAFVVWGMWYNVKYTPQNWTGKTGWHMWETRDVVLPGDPRWPHPEEKEKDEFFDRGFRDRNVFK